VEGRLLKLNLGCGSHKLAGWVNVDKEPACAPDRIVDLESLPWPFESDSVGAVMFRHSLEHLGRTPEIYLGIFRELYRVCAPNAEVTIIAPHPRHDDFISDPTHVRAITPQGLELFSKKKNRAWAEAGLANTPLGLYLDVDFEIVRATMRPAAIWRERLKKGLVRESEFAEVVRHYNNVIREIEVVLAVRK
jgi:hypothetical protein